jgi:PAS domain S-box-containing protein
MWVYDPVTLRFLEVNRAATTLYGYTREEFLQLTARDLHGPDGVAGLQEHLARVDPGAVVASAWKHRTHDGRQLSVELTAQGIQFQGRYARLIVVRDVTPFGDYEAARIDAEARYRALIEYAAEAIVVLDAGAGVFVEANENACRLFGRTREEILSVGVLDVSPESQPDGQLSAVAAPSIIGRALRGEAPVFEWVHRNASGEDILCEVRLVRLPSATHTLIRGSMTDIRERKAAAEEMARLAAIVEFSDDAMLVSGLDGRITTWNRGAEKILGLPASQMLGGSMAEVLGPPEMALRQQIRDQVIGRGEPVSGVEHVWTRPDGTTLAISTSCFPIRNAAGEITGLGAVIRDVDDQHSASAALRLSEQRLQLAVDAAGIGIWNWRIDTGAFEWSEQAAAIFGRPIDGLPDTIGGVIGMFHPEDRDLARLRPPAEVASGNSIETRIRLPDGTYRWIVSSALPMPGDPNTVTGISQDIHDRKVAEEEAIEGERRVRAIIDTLPSAVWIVSGWTALMVNAELERLTGYSAADLISGDALGRVVHPDDAVIMNDHYHKRIVGEETVSRYTIRIIRSDGEVRHLAVSATQFVFGGMACSLLSAIDITDRLLAEQELRASEERFRNLVETVPVGIWVWDGTDVTMVNAALERLLGYSREQITTRDFLGTHMHPDDRALIRERGRRRMAGEPVDPPHVEIRIVNADGKTLTFELWSAIVEVDGKRVWFNSVIDLTERRAAEAERLRIDQQIQQTQKLESLGILAGGIAHDFNNLLVAILGNAGLALMELPPESPARQTVQAIETAAQRAADLTRQMLAYSGKGKFVIEPLNLSRIVEEMAHLLEVSVSKRAVLKYHFAPDIPAIEGDATQVRQVIMNLITNASDAIGSRSGVISISTGMQYADRAYLAESYLDSDLPDGDYVYIEVADSGEGMDEDTRSRIFDPFFTTKFTGRGLGLAAVLGIVRGHHAAIKVYSEPGRGTTFKVLFPAASSATLPAPAAANPEPEPAGGLHRGTVLVVDDDETVRTVTRRILERAGFDVLLAADGVAALDVYRANPGIVLVLLDMTMPRMDGEECFRELRHLDPSVRVVLTSGYNEQDATTRFVGKGLAGFIQKPYRPADLIERVNALLSPPAP